MEDRELLQLCLSVTGMFEDGTAKVDWDVVTGNFDGMGLSCGVLQWCAGQGSLQTLVQNIGQRMGWEKAQTFFRSDIHHFSVLKPREAIQWCLDHYIADGSKNVDPAAKACWQRFLNQPESIEAQIELASNTVLYRAKVIAAKYCPHHFNEKRVVAFFFDLVTQSGGMENAKGKVLPINDEVTLSVDDAITYARLHSPKTAAWWEEAVKDVPALTEVLLHYAYERSKLSRAEYMWDALSRRGSIACRKGIVHNKVVDFTALLD